MLTDVPTTLPGFRSKCAYASRLSEVACDEREFSKRGTFASSKSEVTSRSTPSIGSTVEPNSWGITPTLVLIDFLTCR